MKWKKDAIIICLIQYFEADMESQSQSSEFRNNPEIFTYIERVHAELEMS